MNIDINSTVNHGISFLKESFLTLLTAQQKKILIVASLAFAFLAACYAVSLWYFKAPSNDEMQPNMPIKEIESNNGDGELDKLNSQFSREKELFQQSIDQLKSQLSDSQSKELALKNKVAQLEIELQAKEDKISQHEDEKAAKVAQQAQKIVFLFDDLKDADVFEGLNKQSDMPSFECLQKNEVFQNQVVDQFKAEKRFVCLVKLRTDPWVYGLNQEFIDLQNLYGKEQCALILAISNCEDWLTFIGNASSLLPSTKFRNKQNVLRNHLMSITYFADLKVTKTCDASPYFIDNLRSFMGI